MREHERNRAAWDQAAAFYREGLEESVRLLAAGGHDFHEPEMRCLGRLCARGGLAVHFQCAAGHDTLALLNIGARRVAGIDISGEMVRLAEEKSRRLGADARWFRADVLDPPPDLAGAADLVYTGKGAVNWLMDVRGWARSVARTLRPGGSFYMFEGHPCACFFDDAASSLGVAPGFDGYFSERVHEGRGWPDSYVGDLGLPEDGHAPKHERLWTLSAVIGALLDAGLALRRFEEHPFEYWRGFSNLSEGDRRKIPNTFSLLMDKPA